MTPMTPTQIKTFARLSVLATTAAVTVRSAAAAAAVFADAMRPSGETTTNIQPMLAILDHDLDAAVEALGDAMASLSNVRRLFGLPPSSVVVVAEAVQDAATEAAELCQS